jgi:hypothetical protein
MSDAGSFLTHHALKQLPYHGQCVMLGSTCEDVRVFRGCIVCEVRMPAGRRVRESGLITGAATRRDRTDGDVRLIRTEL